MLSPGPTLVVTRDNFCPEGRRVSSKSPEGQKLSRGTTRVGPGDNNESYPPEGQQRPTFGAKKYFHPPEGKQEKVGFSRKKEDFETFLGRKHWKKSKLALAGKDKAATLKKKVGKKFHFFILYVQFLHLFTKKVDEYNFPSNFTIFPP